MIIPTHCMTCGRVIGHLWERYTKLTKELVKQKHEQNDTLDADHPDKGPRGVALDRLGLDMICCRNAMLSHIDLTSRLRNRYQD